MSLPGRATAVRPGAQQAGVYACVMAQQVSLSALVAGFVAVLIFLTILVVGFVYEWKKGALDWE